MNPSYLTKKDGSTLTDDYFIFDAIATVPTLYCFGPVKHGEFLGTCPIYGVAMVTAWKKFAVAIAKEDKDTYEVEPIEVELIKGEHE